MTIRLFVLAFLLIPLATLGQSNPPPSQPVDLRFTDDTAPETGYFPSEAIWYQDVSSARVSDNSQAIIQWLEENGGWGENGKLQIDFSFHVLQADAGTPFRSFIPTKHFYSPDCDRIKVPVPPGGALEGKSGYECSGDGDCHLIVVHQPGRRLFEMWKANITNDTFSGGCLAVWDLNRNYGPKGRGENCTSADASGFPIAPLLFTADEVRSGAINHAIRFTLPNPKIWHGKYVRPATHATEVASGGENAPPYGVHFRLRADYPLDQLPSDAARVVARALQKYGMFLADGGTITLTAQSDQFTTTKWSGLLGPHDLKDLRVTDFEVIDHGPTFTFSGDCVREP